MTDHRTLLARTITDRPGIHFNGLVRRLDLAPGQVQYHVRDLLEAETIVAASLYGRTHYFPPAYDPADRAALALCHRETTRDVLVALLERGPSDPASVAASLDIARSTLEWHLDRLVEQDLVEKRRDDRGRVTLALAEPRTVVRLLTAIEPSLPQRLVDRYSRLVDRFLDG